MGRLYGRGDLAEVDGNSGGLMRETILLYVLYLNLLLGLIALPWAIWWAYGSLVEYLKRKWREL